MAQFHHLYKMERKKKRILIIIKMIKKINSNLKYFFFFKFLFKIRWNGGRTLGTLGSASGNGWFFIILRWWLMIFFLCFL